MSIFGRKPARLGADRDDKAAARDSWRESLSRRPVRAVWLFLRRNLARMAAVAVAVSLAAFAVALFVFNKYSATAVVMIDPRAGKDAQIDAGAIESLAQIARSEAFLGALVDGLDLTRDGYFGGSGAAEPLQRLATIEKLRTNLSVARRDATYVIEATASAPSPGLAARIANAAARKILDEATPSRLGVSATTAQPMESRLPEARENATRAEQAAEQLRTRLKLADAAQGFSLVEERISELNRQLALASARTAEARARYELLRRAGDADVSLQAAQSAPLDALRAEYARLSRQAAGRAAVLGPRHPEVLRLKAQLADARREVAAENKRALASVRFAYLEAEQGEAALAEELKKARAESAELGPELMKLEELENESKAARDAYGELRERARAKDLDASAIRIVSPALPPLRTTTPPLTLAAGSAALGLLAGLAYATLRERRRDTLNTAAAAERFGGAETLGFIPLIEDSGQEGDKPQKPDLSPWLAELCAELAPNEAGDEGSVLLVASARRGEGRTTVAANLAAYLSQGGDRVLLIEADRPARQTKPRLGLLDILQSGEDLERAFVDPPDASYTFLPFGGRALKRPYAIGGLMSGVTMRALLKLARQWFDLIVIDGPPALEAPYAPLLAARADHVVFLIEWDKTRAEDAEAALQRLDLHDAAAILYNKTDAARLPLYEGRRSYLSEVNFGEAA
ncbi:hypothetical protein V3H18_02955 [Methylocystis sp. 9N]|uniref:Lipopolysaccharide biosynthesis protein n=1 Tax=Methylocystis borbori TaxID=3118750 RepID=A0ABU7XDM0_9HYPH